jgi:predicted  nucleic acid-binding Zn-ribbon protein
LSRYFNFFFEEIVLKMNFISFAVLICGAISFSLQPAHDSTLIEKYKQNPQQFIAAMAEVKPSDVEAIIVLLEGLKADSEQPKADLIKALRDAENALGDAASDVIDAQSAVEAATTAQGLAADDLKEKEGLHEDAQQACNDATKVHNDEIDSLKDEQAVIENVIGMLNALIAPGLIETSGRSLLSPNSLSDPKLLLEMAKVDPQAVQGIIDSLTAPQTHSKAREAEVIQNLADAEDALGAASAAVVAAQGVLQAANDDLSAAQQHLSAMSGVEEAAQDAKDSAETVHNAELPGLENEINVLDQVIVALRDLLARQA